MMKKGGVQNMRKKVNIQIATNKNDKTEAWIQHLIQYIILEQLDISHKLRAKLIYQTFRKDRSSQWTE